MKKVILKGLNKRGKNRVHEHGPEFTIDEKLSENGSDFGENFIFFESVRKSFRLGAGCPLVEWSGWLDVGTEVEIVEIVEEIG